MPISDGQRDLALMENLFSESSGALVAASTRTHVGAQSGKVLRPRFRRVPGLAGDTIKRMLKHASRTTLRLGGEDYALRWISSLVAMPETDVFTMTVAEHRFELELESLHHLLKVPAGWWEHVPGGLRASLLADFLRESGAPADFSVLHAGSSQRAEASAMPCELAFCLSGGAYPAKRDYRGRLRLETLPAAAFLVSGWERLGELGQRRLADFSLPVSIEIFSARLNVVELQRLRRGALVPVGAPLEGKDAVVCVGWGRRFAAPAVINQKIVTLQGGLIPMDESQAVGAGVALSELSKMENLEIQFTVELATCSLPLSELSRLGAGSTLNLGLPHEPPLVRLCVNGRPVATGELVVLGQSLGVQIVDMASA